MRATAAFVVLLGGASSGKSALAVQWGRAYAGPVTFIATAEPGDDEMRERIRRHRDDRPAGWTTIEEPRRVVATLAEAAGDALVIVDCVTLWVANQLDRSDADVLADAGSLADAASARSAPTVVITNEVGMGIVPADPQTRRYRDLLGAVNAALAARATRALLLVAGRVLALDDPPVQPTDLRGSWLHERREGPAPPDGTLV